MNELRCTTNGTLDDSKFSYPMPWIGLYVVAASAACAIAMALDAFLGFHYRKFWFPCKFFALNATTLTLIGVSVKLSVDLNTSMPRSHEQLAKLSSTAFICTTIGNSLPSLGITENKELMMNTMALGIIVVTVIVNVCIQMGTGVIYVFWIEHCVLLLLMVLLYAVMISSALAITSIKRHFELKYSEKYEVAKRECDNNSNPSITRKLRDDLMRYWMMAHTCNPQFVMGRLVTCTASGAFCILSSMTLAEAMFRRYLMPWGFTFCQGESDYRWSTMLILVTQVIAVVVGMIAPAFRWFLPVKFMCENNTMKGFSSVEFYWVKYLHHIKVSGLDLRIYDHSCGRFLHNIKYKALDICISIQRGIIVLSKSIRVISILSMTMFMYFLNKIVKLVKQKDAILRCDEELNSNTTSKQDLSRFVLHLEGEEALIGMMIKNERDATDHWIEMGRRQQPRYLAQLLEKLNPSCGFEGVEKFDDNCIPSLDYEEPPNSWALPIVTLTSIAVATCNADFHSAKELIKCAHEGLKFIRIVEKNIDIKRDLVNIRRAAEVAWQEVILDYKWHDVDLREMALTGKCPKDVISEISDIAKQKFMELKRNDRFGLSYSSSKWPIRVLIANSMYRICQTLLLTIDARSNECSKVMFERLSAMITDIVAACLTNLKHAIPKKCHRSTIEQREDSVRRAIHQLGQTEKILEFLSCQTLPSSDPEITACINEWRAFCREKDQLAPGTSDSNCTNSSDLCLSIN